MAVSNPNPNLPQTISAAADALLSWIKSQPKHAKSQLLDHDEPILLVLTLSTIPSKSRTNPSLIPLPHPLHSPSSAVCFFADDRPSSAVLPDAVRHKIDSLSLPISDVIPLSKLKSDYVPFEARRKLCGSYDLFLADRKILPLLPKLIGKTFFKKKKHPLPVAVGRKGWKQQIERCFGSALLYFSTGTSCLVKVARLSMGRDKIVENLVAAIEGVVRLVPKGWSNVRSLSVKSEESAALPIYRVLPEIKMKIEVGRKEEENVSEVDDGGEKKENGKERMVKKVGTKKGKMNRIRYMDADVEIDGLKSDSGGDSDGQEISELVGEQEEFTDNKKTKKAMKVKEVKVAKKGKKAKKVEETGNLVVKEEAVKKRKMKLYKSEAKEVEGKKSKKVRAK